MISHAMTDKQRKMLKELVDNVTDRPSNIREEHFYGTVFDVMCRAIQNLGGHLKEGVGHGGVPMSLEGQSEDERAASALERGMGSKDGRWA